MQAGETVALVSDAGMPLVNDPGFLLVAACVAAGVGVEVLPGPSAALTALVVSGLPATTWRFVGFLPRKRGELEALFRGAGETLVAFESPRRVGASLAALAAVDAERAVVVCRELTKLHEEVVRGTAASWRRATRPRLRAARSSWSSAARRPEAVDLGAGAGRAGAAGRRGRQGAAGGGGGRRADRRAGQRLVQGAARALTSARRGCQVAEGRRGQTLR